MIKKRQILLITSAAFFVQLIIILYTHFKGMYPINSTIELVVRITYGTLLSSIFISILYYLNMYIIQKLNIQFSWEKKYIARVFIEFFASLIVSIIISITITGTSHIFFPYENGLKYNIINNFFIIAVLNLIFITILEAYYYFVEWNKIKIEAEKLEKENINAKYNVLKSQVNPHFLFNSLNVLSNLIEIDQEKAQVFTEKLSDMYRYILDQIDAPIVSLKNELQFAYDYLDLQKIRHHNKVDISIKIDNSSMQYFLIPLSLQIVIENCFKHNIISERKKISISIYSDNDCLIVKNNYNPKENHSFNSGIGIENLKSRYSLVSERKPEFYLENNYYFAVLPLIKTE